MCVCVARSICILCVCIWESEWVFGSRSACILHVCIWDCLFVCVCACALARESAECISKLKSWLYLVFHFLPLLLWGSTGSCWLPACLSLQLKRLDCCLWASSASASIPAFAAVCVWTQQTETYHRSRQPPLLAWLRCSLDVIGTGLWTHLSSSCVSFHIQSSSEGHSGVPLW